MKKILATTAIPCLMLFGCHDHNDNNNNDAQTLSVFSTNFFTCDASGMDSEAQAVISKACGTRTIYFSDGNEGSVMISGKTNDDGSDLEGIFVDIMSEEDYGFPYYQDTKLQVLRFETEKGTIPVGISNDQAVFDLVGNNNSRLKIYFVSGGQNKSDSLTGVINIDGSTYTFKSSGEKELNMSLDSYSKSLNQQ